MGFVVNCNRQRVLSWSTIFGWVSPILNSQILGDPIEESPSPAKKLKNLSIKAHFLVLIMKIRILFSGISCWGLNILKFCLPFFGYDNVEKLLNTDQGYDDLERLLNVGQGDHISLEIIECRSMLKSYSLRMYGIHKTGESLTLKKYASYSVEGLEKEVKLGEALRIVWFCHGHDVSSTWW